MQTLAKIFSKIGKSLNIFSVENKEDNLDFLEKTDRQLLEEDWTTVCKDLDIEEKR